MQLSGCLNVHPHLKSSREQHQQQQTAEHDTPTPEAVSQLEPEVGSVELCIRAFWTIFEDALLEFDRFVSGSFANSDAAAVRS